MTESATQQLAAWQKKRLETVHVDRTDYGVGPSSLTVLSYYWGAGSERPDTQFYRVESAFRETWLHCGMMKSVIVTDKPTKSMESFAEKFPALEIQVEPSLVPGDIFTMSIDCDSRLEKRFETEYLMIIQDDGFPLQKGIDQFLGKWDFIGAPYVRNKFLPTIIARLFNLWTANGGFSVRSKKMCEMAADYWRGKYKNYVPQDRKFAEDVHLLGEDAYYTETLLKREWKYNRAMKMADNRVALRFAYDKIVPQRIHELPFGFHRAETFAEFVERGWMN